MNASKTIARTLCAMTVASLLGALPAAGVQKTRRR